MNRRAAWLRDWMQRAEAQQLTVTHTRDPQRQRALDRVIAQTTAPQPTPAPQARAGQPLESASG